MTDQKKKFFIIDFDSTFAKVESLDELLASTLAAQHDGEEIIKEIKKITDLSESSFTHSHLAPFVLASR